jgi:hypothetical protein
MNEATPIEAEPPVDVPKEEAKKLTAKQRQELLSRVVKRREYNERKDKDNRERQEKDTKFVYVPMAQWDEETVALRKGWGDPSLEFPQLKQFINQVVNDMRQKRPGIRVYPASEDASVKMADILQGLTRKIEVDSQAESVYDNGYLHAVVGGRGYWRIMAEYDDDETFNQSLRIRKIVNPSAVRMDTDYSMPDASDINWALIEEEVSTDEFKERWPKAEAVSFDSETSIKSWWCSEDSVIVADYYERHCDYRTLIALPNGAVAWWDEVEEMFGVKPAGSKTREVEQYSVTWVTVAGGEQILEEHEWPGTMIPVIQCAGDEIFVEGRRMFQGLITQAKSTQQLFNYGMTQQAIHLSLTPRAPYIAAEGQVEQYKKQWEEANTRNWGVLIYTPVTIEGQAVPPPQRQQPASPDSGWLNWTQQMTMLMKSIIGMYENNLGQRGQEISGRAIIAREQQGDNATFHYADNLGRAIAHTGRVLMECIRYFYDAEQVVHISGHDEKQKPIKINERIPVYDQITKQLVGEFIENDIKKGRFSVVIDSGPSYKTKRLEQADTMNQLVKVAPQIMQLAPDLVLKVQDIPGADEFAERARVMLPPPIQAMLQAKEAGENPEMAGLLQQLQAGQQQLQQMEQGMQQLQQQLQMLQKDKEASIAASNARQAVAEASGANEEANQQIEMQRLLLDRMQMMEEREDAREQREIEREKMANERDKVMADLFKTVLTTQASTEQAAMAQQSSTAAAQENP